ncbi:hypothetical protein M514_02069, partial [Trichuris suis]
MVAAVVVAKDRQNRCLPDDTAEVCGSTRSVTSSLCDNFRNRLINERLTTRRNRSEERVILTRRSALVYKQRPVFGTGSMTSKLETRASVRTVVIAINASQQARRRRFQ